jgi:hypothetical protein
LRIRAKLSSYAVVTTSLKLSKPIVSALLNDVMKSCKFFEFHVYISSEDNELDFITENY